MRASGVEGADLGAQVGGGAASTRSARRASVVAQQAQFVHPITSRQHRGRPSRGDHAFGEQRLEAFQRRQAGECVHAMTAANAVARLRRGGATRTRSASGHGQPRRRLR